MIKNMMCIFYAALHKCEANSELLVNSIAAIALMMQNRALVNQMCVFVTFVCNFVTYKQIYIQTNVCVRM